MNILIVGAGPAGLTAGVELARRGIAATIIDRRAGGSTLSRAVGIVPLSLKLLEPSGVTARLLDEGIQMQAVKFYSGDKQLAAIPLGPAKPQYGYGHILMLPQDQTEAALADAFTALGGVVRYDTGFEGLTQDDDAVAVTLNGGACETYDYVVGADGIKSSVRGALGLDYPGHDLGETWSIADVNCEGWANPDDFTLCILPAGGIAVVAPIGVDRCRVISNTPDALKSLPLPMEITQINREGQFTISVRQVGDYRKGRVFLAGDAAHCHSPVGGRGMNLGIADACELAACFERGDLDRYSRVRHKAGAATIAGSERVRKMATATNPLRRIVFHAALKTVGASRFLRSKMAEGFLYG